jgi:hypothetical protein
MSSTKKHRLLSFAVEKTIRLQVILMRGCKGLRGYLKKEKKGWRRIENFIANLPPGYATSSPPGIDPVTTDSFIQLQEKLRDSDGVEGN